MDTLLILYIILLALNIFSQIFLYRNKEDNIKPYFLSMFTIIALSVFVYLAYPSNYYMVEKSVAIIMAILTGVSVLLRHKEDKFSKVSRGLLTFALVINLSLLYF